jgi:hypothetical protein
MVEGHPIQYDEVLVGQQVRIKEALDLSHEVDLYLKDRNDRLLRSKNPEVVRRLLIEIGFIAIKQTIDPNFDVDL